MNKTANREIGAPGKPSPVWHSRGYIPHFESPNRIQHVTFHLADSLPQKVLRQLDSELKALPGAKRDVERRKRLEDWIDAGHGSCILQTPGISAMVQDSLLTFDGTRYRLLAWVVMPNHVHVLFEPLEGRTVATIVASWKKFTARKIGTADGDGFPGNANLPIGEVARAVRGTPTPIWHREYWDRYIRDERHLNRTTEYIHQNPVKAGLAASPESWPWSSANPNCRGTQTST